MSDLIDRQDAIKAIRCGHLSAATIYGRSDEGMMVLAESIRAINSLPSAQPELDEWCDDCKEYDHERHCCPRWSRVIKSALEESERIQKVINVTLDEDKVARVVEHRKKMQERKKGKENENTVHMQ